MDRVGSVTGCSDVDGDWRLEIKRFDTDNLLISNRFSSTVQSDYYAILGEDSETFGQVIKAAPPRLVQLAAKITF